MAENTVDRKRLREAVCTNHESKSQFSPRNCSSHGVSQSVGGVWCTNRKHFGKGVGGVPLFKQMLLPFLFKLNTLSKTSVFDYNTLKKDNRDIL